MRLQLRPLSGVENPGCEEAAVRAGCPTVVRIVLSLFAENEFQAIQFVPVVITSKVLVGGTFLPVEDLPTDLEWPARVMPLTYVIDAMTYVVNGDGTAGESRTAVVVPAAFAVAAILLDGAFVRRAQ